MIFSIVSIVFILMQLPVFCFQFEADYVYYFINILTASYLPTCLCYFALGIYIKKLSFRELLFQLVLPLMPMGITLFSHLNYYSSPAIISILSLNVYLIMLSVILEKKVRKHRLLRVFSLVFITAGIAANAYVYTTSLPFMPYYKPLYIYTSFLIVITSLINPFIISFRIIAGGSKLIIISAFASPFFLILSGAKLLSTPVNLAISAAVFLLPIISAIFIKQFKVKILTGRGRV